MRALRSRAVRWWLLAAFWAVMVVLGVGGFRQQADDDNLDRSNLDTVYLTMQLVMLEYDESDTTNWQLDIARFAAPLVAAGTIFQTLSIVFRDQFARLRARRSRGHTVVFGLGGTGSRLVAALAGAGRRVVGVERDPGADGVQAAKALDIPVLIGDVTDAAVVAAARLDRAAQAVVVCGADATNVELTVALRRQRRAGGRPPLRCAVHLTDAELCALLRGAELRDAGTARVEFFNLHERAAHTWIAEHPPFGDGTRPPHLVVLGLGQLGRGLVVAAAQHWSASGDGPLRLTLVDRVADGRWHALCLQHPALADACATTTLDFDIESPSESSVGAFHAAIGGGSVTAVAVTFEDESLALSTGMLVHQTLPGPVAGAPVPVVVRTRSDAGVGVLLAPTGADAEVPFPGLVVFPFLDRACTLDVVDGGIREQLARSIHEDYLARTTGTSAFRRRWEDLSDEDRELSRSGADGVIHGLAAIGCELVPLRHWGAPATTFTDAEVETLARFEHERWRVERVAAGWRHGPQRDDHRKLNPLLMPWDELPRPDMERNRDAARARPPMLARAGFEPVRRRLDAPTTT